MVKVIRIADRTIVALKVSRRLSTDGRRQLENNLSADCLWYGPDQCLLVSDTLSADAIIKDCNGSLVNDLHNAVEYSSALAVFNLSGDGSRDLLATDCGVDFRTDSFATGNCCRTRLAQIPAIVSAEGAEHFDVYVDRSYDNYLSAWLHEEQSKRPSPLRTA